jgi:hypothetical protein
MNWLAMETPPGRAIYRQGNEGTPGYKASYFEEEG